MEAIPQIDAACVAGVTGGNPPRVGLFDRRSLRAKCTKYAGTSWKPEGVGGVVASGQRREMGQKYINLIYELISIFILRQSFHLICDFISILFFACPYRMWDSQDNTMRQHSPRVTYPVAWTLPSPRGSGAGAYQGAPLSLQPLGERQVPRWIAAAAAQAVAFEHPVDEDNPVRRCERLWATGAAPDELQRARKAAAEWQIRQIRYARRRQERALTSGRSVSRRSLRGTRIRRAPRGVSRARRSSSKRAARSKDPPSPPEPPPRTERIPRQRSAEDGSAAPPLSGTPGHCACLVGSSGVGRLERSAGLGDTVHTDDTSARIRVGTTSARCRS